MNRPSKKHHFVPQAQLRHFAADANRHSIHVFDKHFDRVFLSSILNAASENDFNTIPFTDGEWNFEGLFRDVDGKSAKLISEIISRRSIGWLRAEDRVALAELVATQLLRTHFSRKTPRHFAEQLRELVRKLGYNPDDDSSMTIPSDVSLRLGAVEAFLKKEGHVIALLRLVPALYASSGAEQFVISDHPVTVTNAFPYGELGLASQGVLVLLPISPELSIALHCPTIVQHYDTVGRADLDPERKERMLQYREGLLSGMPIEVDAGTVVGFNQRQITQSWRYLYSARDEFKFVRQFLANYPDYRKVETHVHMGEMGSGPGRRSDMPKGLQLVVFGPHDHCMLQIDKVDVAGEGITARTSRTELLEKVAADMGMLRVNLYVDGNNVRMMNQSMIERFGEPSEGWFRVVHRDRALRALDIQLDKKEKKPPSKG